MNKFRTIRSILFMTYSLIIIVFFAVLVIWFYWWASGLLRTGATDTLGGLGRSMQERIDSEMTKMNDVSLDVMYSNLIKNNFKKYMSDMDGELPEGTAGSPPAGIQVENAKELSEILTAAIGPSRPVEQLYLYDFDNNAYGNGFDNGERAYDPEDKPWFRAVMDNTNGKIIGPPVLDEEMSRFISSREKQYSISLYRLFYDPYNAPMGIVEVKQYYNRIFEGAADFAKQNPFHAKVVVYDDTGRIFYPLEDDAEQSAAYVLLPGDGAAGIPDAFRMFVNPVTKEKELLASYRSDVTGWHTTIAVSESELLAPIADFAERTVLIAAVILLFAIFLSFVAAKRITLPIMKIHRAVRNMRLEDLGSARALSKELNSGLSELDQLHWSFLKMNTRLKQSMDELLLAQSQELQAKMVALNSQMNPHFLYNALATIHAMAEENMNGQIVAMTENMSGFLRYISSDESASTVEAELLHTQKYLEINQIRYGRKLQFELAIDERILPLSCPKLIVQPLVENALKFGTQQEPPWRIRIAGRLHDDGWQIEVADNGGGFSRESLDLLHGKIREIDETNAVPMLKLDGMGLLNIYIRLKLTFGEGAVFRVGNKTEEGASIVIGGPFLAPHNPVEGRSTGWKRRDGSEF
ncbi:sensor histidine kinase [Paenibacillus arenilitoris]|uniref:Histidine kinase n=1 Tax=Paenibacillus arenilitoris TaxID=2772299 RepID=A0A927H8R9_9BACL|nr:histidine kinase [Paenibacillus arenilitoris]MBD2871983.1 histidine kinase [Paenibacillus arenilitoris]